MKCGTCSEEKDLTSFGPRERLRKTPVCHSCGALRAKKYRVENGPKLRKKRREYYWSNPDKWRDSHLRLYYKISLDEWNELFKSQGEKCAICNTDTPLGRGWQTDHCHKTLKVRGILCHHCNSLLGHAMDNPSILLKSIEYLESK